MTYSVHQHWDPLKVCAVGRSYPPEFYSHIQNTNIRSIMERIAQETEEDYQKLIRLLESFGVEVVRSDIPDVIEDSLHPHADGVSTYPAPIMCPRDFTAMIGDTYYAPQYHLYELWNKFKTDSWPSNPPTNPSEFNALPAWIKNEFAKYNINSFESLQGIKAGACLQQLEEKVKSAGNKIVYNTGINSAQATRIGKDLYFGTDSYDQNPTEVLNARVDLFPDYRCHVINTGGHSDGVFCPVVPGLIVSIYDVPTYAETFPGWEVAYLPYQDWSNVKPFLDLKQRNKGKWWVPGEEFNDDFTDYIEQWFGHWVGYVEETVFDVNMLVIDEKNVVCMTENKTVFDAFKRYGITPHVINFRHRYFWDGGLHCITSDLHREGTQKDYFPERG